MVLFNKICQGVKSRPYLFFITPGLCLYLLFVLYPLVSSFFNSFTSWDGLGEKEYVALGNYIKLFTDELFAPSFFNALKNGVIIVVLSYVFQLPLAFYFAYIIDKKIRGADLFKLIIFLPQVISTAAISLMVLLFLDPSFGVINNILNAIGLESWTRGWLGEAHLLKGIVAAILTWKGIGIPMMLILANLQSVPKEYIEASMLDGAGEVRRFFSVILPLLIPSLTTTFVMIFLGGIAAFDAPYLLGGDTGGPAGAADTMGTMFYRITFGSEYLQNNIGLGTALAVIQFIIMLFISALQMFLLRKHEVEY